MVSPSKSHDWAREACVDAFRERGVRLREDDSILIVAAVFRRALDAWLAENEQELSSHTLDLRKTGEEIRKSVGAIIREEGEGLREHLRQDVRSASYAAEQAVQKALNISGRHSHWKYRMEGVAIGVVIVLLGMGMMLYLHR